MPQFIKKRQDAAQAEPTADNAPTCPKCESAKVTIAGSVAGRVWLRCDECGFNFSVDENARS